MLPPGTSRTPAPSAGRPRNTDRMRPPGRRRDHGTRTEGAVGISAHAFVVAGRDRRLAQHVVMTGDDDVVTGRLDLGLPPGEGLGRHCASRRSAAVRFPPDRIGKIVAIAHHQKPDVSDLERVTFPGAVDGIGPLFETEGTTFSEFVLNARLLKAHRMLTDPRLAGRAIISVALDTGSKTSPIATEPSVAVLARHLRRCAPPHDASTDRPEPAGTPSLARRSGSPRHSSTR